MRVVLMCVVWVCTQGLRLLKTSRVMTTMMAKEGPAKREFRTLKPIPCSGSFVSVSDGSRIDSVFLGPTKMETEVIGSDNDNDENVLLYNILPVPVRSEVEIAIRAASTPGAGSLSASRDIITSRDGGFFDELSTAIPLFQGTRMPGANSNQEGSALSNFSPAKKMVFEFVQGRGKDAIRTFQSPYHAMTEALRVVGSFEVKGLLLEVADRPSQESILVGGAVLLVEQGANSDDDADVNGYEDEDEWKLTAGSAVRIIRRLQGKTTPAPGSSTKKAYFIKCFSDELVGFAHASKLPVIASASVFDALCVNGLLQRFADNEMTLTAPYFRDQRELDQWQVATAAGQSPSDGGGSTSDKDKASGNGDGNGNGNNKQKSEKADWWEQQKGQAEPKRVIDDATTFLRMTVPEKREWIRRYGGLPVYRIPRPREGGKALDAAILPLLDVEVTYEILRRLAESGGDYEAASQLADYESKKPLLAREINVATAKQDEAMALALCAKLDGLSRLPYNPFSPFDGVASWDLEKWYYENRKKIYNILA